MSKLRVWWIPQAGATEDSFYVPVETVEEGKKVMDMLAAYDAYQRQNRIKPDYCNCGGVQRCVERFFRLGTKKVECIRQMKMISRYLKEDAT